jgi:hypothetical protein
MDAGATFVEKGGLRVITCTIGPPFMAGFALVGKLNNLTALATPARESFLIGLCARAIEWVGLAQMQQDEEMG